MKTPVDDTVLEITRILEAPPTRVFGAWLNREEWQAWIGPEGVTCEVSLLEARVGGRYRLTMNLSDGKTLRVAGVYRAIDEPWRLVFTWGREGDDKQQSLVTITFRDLGGKTELTLRQEGLGTIENRDAHARGCNSALNKLAGYLTQPTDVRERR